VSSFLVNVFLINFLKIKFKKNNQKVVGQTHYASDTLRGGGREGRRWGRERGMGRTMIV